MYKILYKKRLSSISFIIIAVLMFFCTSTYIGQAEPPSEIQQKLIGISEEEKEVLQTLFTLAQEISVLEREEKELDRDMEVMAQKIKDVEARILAEESAYEKNQDGLGKILKSYQKMGPGSYLEIIMNSDSLSSFLRRINTLRDIARNAGALLERLEEGKERLAAERESLKESLGIMEEKQKKSRETLAKVKELKIKNEQYLASLKGEKEHYQSYLYGIQQMWSQLKPFFSEAAAELSSLIKDGALPRDTIKLSLSFFSIKGIIEQKTFNEIISKSPRLSEMEFTFLPDKIEMRLPSRNLTLSGKFVIHDENTLKLKVEEGSFYEMPLEKGSIEELFKEGELLLDFKPLLGKYTLRSVVIKEGYLELTVR